MKRKLFPRIDPNRLDTHSWRNDKGVDRRQLPHVLLALCLAAAATSADARKGFGMGGPSMDGGGGDGGGRGAGMVERRTADVRATGMTPIFPDGFKCEPVSSPYGSPTRYDGSYRRDDRNGGLHGGMDISLDSGTPLLAVARATVIAKGTGGQLEGNYLWLKLSPADTGLPFHMFAKYQHLSEVPALNEGDVVEAGQRVALSGNSGTAGGHYGAAGYPHLHLSITAGPSGEFEKLGMFGSMIRGRGARSVDPLLLYATGVEDPEQSHALPEERKRVAVPVVGPDDRIHPAGSKVVWPVQCRPLG